MQARFGCCPHDRRTGRREEDFAASFVLAFSKDSERFEKGFLKSHAGSKDLLRRPYDTTEVYVLARPNKGTRPSWWHIMMADVEFATVEAQDRYPLTQEDLELGVSYDVLLPEQLRLNHCTVQTKVKSRRNSLNDMTETRIIGSGPWLKPNGGIDEVTGWQMLELMETKGSKERRDVLQRWKRDEDKYRELCRERRLEERKERRRREHRAALSHFRRAWDWIMRT